MDRGYSSRQTKHEPSSGTPEAAAPRRTGDPSRVDGHGLAPADAAAGLHPVDPCGPEGPR